MYDGAEKFAPCTKMKKEKNLKQIESFMRLRSFALIGASARKKKFGNLILSTLLKKGYRVFPVHKSAHEIEGVKCYYSLSDLPEKPEGIILSVKPEEAQHLIKEIIEAGINNVWFQQGSESAKAVTYCILNGLNVVNGECVLMFTEHAGFPHNLHKWIWGIGTRQ